MASRVIPVAGEGCRWSSSFPNFHWWALPKSPLEVCSALTAPTRVAYRDARPCRGSTKKTGVVAWALCGGSFRCLVLWNVDGLDSKFWESDGSVALINSESYHVAGLHWLGHALKLRLSHGGIFISSLIPATHSETEKAAIALASLLPPPSPQPSSSNLRRRRLHSTLPVQARDRVRPPQGRLPILHLLRMWFVDGWEVKSGKGAAFNFKWLVLQVRGLESQIRGS
jgi:hypothetical protein